MANHGQGAEFLVGTVLEGAYRVLRLIGEGGMGAVFEATQLRLNKRVAVKVMASQLADNPEAMARFRREAEVTSGLGHPNIVQVFDFGSAPSGEPYLVMEYLEGEDFEHRLATVGKLAAPDTLSIIRQVAAALAATHEQGIVHRDLKPANIFLLRMAGQTDFAKVLDFGISKVTASTSRLTRSSALMGTPNYMSPEQALGKTADVDHRSDQWALACIAWESLVGTGPFTADTLPSVLFQVVHEPPPPLSAELKGTFPDLETVLLRALAKNKEERFTSITEFSAALEGAIGAAARSASNLAEPDPSPTGSAGFAQRKRTGPSSRSAGRPPSTLSQTAGELAALGEETRRYPPWLWPSLGGAAAVLLLGGVLLFVPGRSPRPVPAGPKPAASTMASPSQVAPSPPAPMVPAAPPAPAMPSTIPPEAPAAPAAQTEALRPEKTDKPRPPSKRARDREHTDPAQLDDLAPVVPRRPKVQRNLIKEL